MHTFVQRSRGRFRTLVSCLAFLLAPASLVAGAAPPPAAGGEEPPAPRLELEDGDHLCLIGNTLAERMQYDGWLETIIQSRFPERNLVFRNLGYSGDELTLRLRSANFGSPDEHLTRQKADVIFAFFGFNESFAGEAGLEKFKKELETFIKETLKKRYNGKSGPRLVLFSPIGHEDLHDRNLPDGSENNGRIKVYTAAMAEVARSSGVLFVDLFAPSRKLYAESPKPLTLNGIHLTEYGNRLLARVIDRALFPALREPALDTVALEKLRAAVLDKDFHWFNRHRIVDGYSVYGGRAGLRFVDGQTNKDVMDRELEVLDVMTANRDRRVWAVARGGELQVDDGNTPPFIPVKTNKPGSGPGGTHLFLDGEEAIAHMTVHPGMKVNLFASEKEFPELANPVQMAFDTKGRLWVAVMPSYPHWKPKEEMNDKVLILEDLDGDGKADRCKVFADHLHVPTGLEFWGGGLFVAQAPCLVFFKDLYGNDRADVRERVLHGLDSADTHHTMNSFVLDPGGALYFQEGTFHHTQVETIDGPQRCANAGVFRYEPRTQKFEVYVTYGFANPHGHVFDRWGQDFVTDGTGNVNYYATAFSGHLDYPSKHAGMQPYFHERVRPCPGTEILSSRHFPEEMQGNLLDANVIGLQGILQYRFRDQGSGFTAEEMGLVLQSDDPSFRPADMEIGPDGALYFLDWQNPLIGHMQHNLRDPSRDRTHGRIYRVTYPSRPLLTPARIAGEPVERLLDLLKEPEDRVRYRARIELSGRPMEAVTTALRGWIAGLDRKDPDYPHHLLEALWAHQSQNVVEVDLLKRVLGSPDFRARAAATRVLSSWRDRVPGSLEILKGLAADPHPRVRLEAVRAASFYRSAEAVEVALISADQPTDYYLDYTRGETMKALEPYWKKAVAEARRVPVTSAAGARFFLKSMTTEELLKLEPDRAVSFELLFRSGVEEVHRREALRSLARLEKESEPRVLLRAIRQVDGGEEGGRAAVLYDLVRLLAAREPLELRGARSEIEKLASAARLAVTRQIGFAALITADGGGAAAWELAQESSSRLRDLVNAVPLIPDASLRAGLYPRVESLLHGLPGKLAQPPEKAGKSRGRYVRVELPGRRTLTLAEVEVYSGGRNLARGGKPSQKNTAHGGEAGRAIDGNTAGSYGGGGQTHTEESTPDPWWEVALPEDSLIDSVVIYNRTDGELGKRLDGFTLKVLDADRNEVFVKERIPAPAPRSEIEVGGAGPESLVRRAAMNALTYVRGQEGPTWKALAGFIRADLDRAAAIRAIQRIPRSFWSKDEARPLLESITGYVRAVPAGERTSPAVLEALQLGEALAALLPAEEARIARGQLGELGVRVIRIGAVPHQMLYDQDRFAVLSGKPVEVIFENADIMPHNFVVTVPGALEEIGLAAEATATQKDALERQYVPVSKKVLQKTRLVQPTELEKLSFTAPETPGVYPYVCTYPGHWRRMFGAMYVVEDLEGYLADADGYLQSHPLKIADKMLEFRRPRKEWKLEELASSLEELDHGRSFGNGRQMFQVANCITCHRLEGTGNEFGPDLQKLEPKVKPIDILRSILEPSAQINEKYFSYTFLMKTGELVTGLIVGETPESVKVIVNPLASTQPAELKRSQIRRQEKSPISTMPEGLLNTLTREEILDLVAYLEARGDRNHKAFQGSCGHDPAR